MQNKRVDGKVKQEFIRYIGKDMKSYAVRRVMTSDTRVMEVRRSLDVEAVHRISMRLGMNALIPQNAMILVYSQLLDRPSINQMQRYLEETEILRYLGLGAVDSESLYAVLSDLGDLDFGKIEEKLSGIFLGSEKSRKTVIVDVTDTYFTGESIDSRPRKGKEGRVKKLMQIALVVTEKHGFPLMHRTYGGNISNRKIFKDLTKDLWLHGYSVIVMDRGMIDPDGIEDLMDLGFSIIAGLRKTRGMKEIVDPMRGNIFSRSNMVKLRNTTVYCIEKAYSRGKVIVVYNPALEAIKRNHYYEHSSDESVARYLGYSIIFHNTALDTKDVVRKYFEKDIVERAFRQMKGILDLRPVRAWLKIHRESHVKVCYLAYAILSYLNYILERRGITGPSALDSLKTGYRVYLKDDKSGFEWNALVDLKAEQRDIMDVVIKKT